MVVYKHIYCVTIWKLNNPNPYRLLLMVATNAGLKQEQNKMQL